MPDNSTTQGAPARELELSAVRKATWRLIPFLGLCYFFAYLDRSNIGFAALEMNKNLGFSPTVYSIGAGIFFVGYFLFEVPSNIALEKFGARRWIARIMVSWGIISVLMALIAGVNSFYALRFLLGLAEAGFFPGILLYLTYWFPAEYRARIVAGFLVAVPVSSTIGAPVSALLLDMHGLAGLKGWQWMFVLEGLPSVLLGIVVLFYLPDRPEKAHWLTQAEKDQLSKTLAAERAAKENIRKLTLGQTLGNGDVWGLAAIYFGFVAALYGTTFWLPQIVKGFGLTVVQTGFVTAIPYLVATLAMIFWSRSSDRRRERVWHNAIPLALAGLGLAASALLDDPKAMMVALTLASVGIYCAFALFWTLPSAILTGASAAAGIALINSVGNLAGFAGPYAIGWMKETTGGYSAGLMAVAILPLIASALALAFGKLRARELAAGEAQRG